MIKEGQRLEASLQERMNQPATRDIVFEAANVTIVENGVTITAAHISKIQRAVKERLDEMETETRDQMRRDQEQIQWKCSGSERKPKKRWKPTATSWKTSTVVAQGQNSRQRDELQELRPFTFLTESRYRELKQRWGQVFRADMGAEAFYDILRRLDLEQLSEGSVARSAHLEEQAEAQEGYHADEGGGIVPPLVQPPGMDDSDGSAGHSSRSAPDGAVGRWALCYL